MQMTLQAKKNCNIPKTKQEKSARPLQDDLQTLSSWCFQRVTTITVKWAYNSVLLVLSSFANLRQNILSRNCKVADKMVLNCNGSSYVSGKLPTYPSPKPTLTLTSHLGQKVEKQVVSFPETYDDLVQLWSLLRVLSNNLRLLHSKSVQYETLPESCQACFTRPYLVKKIYISV